MVKFLAITLAFGALLSPTSAVTHRMFTNFPSEIRVGQLVYLTWDLDPGESVGVLTLEHEGNPGEVLQYETIVRKSTMYQNFHQNSNLRRMGRCFGPQ